MTLHNIPPVYDSHSRLLILGSFPSVRSRETGFFYGHPQNRFWKVTATVFGCKVPESVAEKKAFLLANGVALWDVVASCEIVGSSDSSITDVVPNDVERLLRAAPIARVFVNGRTAAALWHKYLEAQTGIRAVCLPSTSPANAAWSVEALIDAWKVIR